MAPQLQLPVEIINTILSYHRKEYYWNRFVKRWHIRFIRKYLDEKFSYLFEQVSTRNLPESFSVIIYRKYCKIHLKFVNTTMVSVQLRYDVRTGRDFFSRFQL
jgi:hypothetical protein